MDVLDSRSADRVDAFIANSEVIRERIRRYYRRDATVIYPPVDTDAVDPDRSDGDFYLMVGRIVESKRPMTIVQAFDGIDATLRIAGGSDNEPILGTSTYEDVVAAATEASGVETLGYVSDERKQELLRTAKAVVYVPVREDFGMVPIEALAAGTPVIAANEGFPAIAIDDGETGFVVEPTVAGIRRGVERIETTAFDPDKLAEAAQRYSTDRFNKRITTAVKRFRSDPDVYRPRDEPLVDD
jgi:glycosyltransferase involved in cell wall biosynthesis